MASSDGCIDGGPVASCNTVFCGTEIFHRGHRPNWHKGVDCDKFGTSIVKGEQATWHRTGWVSCAEPK